MDSHAHANEARTYAKVLGALLMFTAVTVLAAGVNFGSSSVNVVIALGIATIKASLVALFFMHLKSDKPMNAIIFVSGAAFLAVFLIFCLIDIESRERVRPSYVTRLPVAAAQPGKANIAQPGPANPAQPAPAR